MGRVQAEAPPDLPFSPFHYQQAQSCALCTARCSFGNCDNSGMNCEQGARMQIERQHEYVPDGQGANRAIIPVQGADTAATIDCSQVCYHFICTDLFSCTPHNSSHPAPSNIPQLGEATSGTSHHKTSLVCLHPLKAVYFSSIQSRNIENIDVQP